MSEPKQKTELSTQAVLRARSSAAGFSAMCFIGCLTYLAAREGNLIGLVSIRGVIVIIAGLLIAAFVLGYLLLFCRLWLTNFTTVWLASAQAKAASDQSPTKTLAGERLLSILGTALMVIQLVLIFVMTRWAYQWIAVS